MRSKKQNTHRLASKEVFHQLAVKNVKKSARDYLIYFLTLTLAVALFYTFNSIESQFSVLGIPNAGNFLSFSAGMIGAVSLFICLIMGFLVVYANRFMLKRRKREMGIYLTLGMELEDISALMWKETCFIGGGALVCGLGLGIIFSQGLSLVTAKLIGAGTSNYHFVLSIKATLAAIFFFGCMFFFVYLLNVREIKKMQLIELLHASKKNEKVSKGKIRDVLFFGLSVLLMVFGYISIFTDTRISFSQGLFTGIGLIGAGTILFCLSVSGFFVKICRKNKKYYYTRLHLFVVNQLGSRLKNAGVSIGVVSILICLAVSSMALGLGMGGTPVGNADQLAPYDVSFRVEGTDMENGSSNQTAEQVLEEKGLKLSDYTKETAEYKVYTTAAINYGLFASEKYPSEDGIEDYPVSIIGADDYNRAMELQGVSPVVLGEHEYAINYSETGGGKKLAYYMEHDGQTLNLLGDKLTPAREGLFKQVYYDENAFTDSGTLIIPQRLTKGLNLDYAICSGKYQTENSYKELIEVYKNIPETLEFTTHEKIKIEVLSDTLTVTYIGIYLGITFLIVAGAVLALQQLSQASDNEGRYALLRNLGAKEKDIREALFTQLKAYFGLPFLLALVNAGFIIGGIYCNMPELTPWIILQTIMFSAGLVIVVYGLYFLVTYLGSRRILKLGK